MTGRTDGVLAGYDGSPGSEHALSWAAREARSRGIALTVCHAWAPGFAALPSEAAVAGLAAAGQGPHEARGGTAAADQRAGHGGALRAQPRCRHAGRRLPGPRRRRRDAAGLGQQAGCGTWPLSSGGRARALAVGWWLCARSRRGRHRRIRGIGCCAGLRIRGGRAPRSSAPGGVRSCRCAGKPGRRS
jgi:hypothetical protein